MSLSFAPTASRIPISLVRSVTDTSMMFMMPIPPTTRETDAMAPRSMLMIRVDASATASISDRFLTEKSSSCPAWIRWRCRRRAVTCSSASLIRAPSTAWTRTTPTVPMCGFLDRRVWTVVRGAMTVSS